MPRVVAVTLSVVGALVVVLAVALGMVGSQFDQLRLSQDDLRFAYEDLRQHLSTVTQERDRLATEMERQERRVSQLRAELDRLERPPTTVLSASDPAASVGTP